MERDIYSALKIWKNDTRRKPLIIRGARQTGKTWLTRQFGNLDFKNFIEINFEFSPQYKSFFSTLNPIDIIEKIEISENVTVIKGETLLFFDEIQECPQALKALRYFYEIIPDLHIIAAGSLLEFIMDPEQMNSRTRHK